MHQIQFLASVRLFVCVSDGICHTVKFAGEILR